MLHQSDRERERQLTMGGIAPTSQTFLECRLLSLCLKSLQMNKKEKAAWGERSRKTAARGYFWMNYGSTLKTPLSLLFLLFSGYEMSSSGLGDAARWESRHLLQELFTTEIQVYIEPEKNCTDPGETCAGLRRPERSSIVKPHPV